MSENAEILAVRCEMTELENQLRQLAWFFSSTLTWDRELGVWADPVWSARQSAEGA
jgi:hypothetical protein